MTKGEDGDTWVAPTTGATAESLTTEHIGRYEQRGEIGRGGIGRVVCAFDQHVGREVAIKELLFDGATAIEGDERARTEVRFLDEARITGQLEHPGIVPVHELGQRPDGTVYYTMQLVRGRTLAKALEDRTLSERLELLGAVVDATNAVAYAHSRGVVHRDLKPSNIMVGEFGETVVLDWGLAKLRGESDPRMTALADTLDRVRRADDALTLAGAPIGTPSYMSPEQARGELDAIDERSDVYCLGAILYHVLTGRPPNRGSSAQETVSNAARGAVVPPREVVAEVAPELEAIAMRALSLGRDRRYPTAKELADDLRTFLAGGLVVAHRYSPWALTARWLRKNAAAIAVAVGVLLVAGGVWWSRGYTDRQAHEAEELVRRADVKDEVLVMLDEAAEGGRRPGWLELSTFRLIALEEPFVEGMLIARLDDPAPNVRRLAARSLGGMKSVRAVPPLIRRLDEDVGESERVAIDVINALGVIGDGRADTPVDKARRRYGQFSHVWLATELAYEMIPLAPLDLETATAEQLYYRAQSLNQKDNPKEALALYDRAIARDPKYVKALLNRGIVRSRLGDHDAAIDDYDRALEIEPNNTLVRNSRGVVLKRIGDLEGALADLDVVVASGEHGAVALNNRGLVHKHLGHVERAIADFNRALELEPKKVSVHVNLSSLWLQKGDLDRSLVALNHALAIQPNYEKGLLARGSVRLLLGDIPAALTDVETAVALDPTESRPYEWRGRLRLVSKDATGARADFDRAVELAPDRPQVWAERAVYLHYASGDDEAARADLDRAIAIARNPTPYRIHRAAIDGVRPELGEVSKADELVERFFAKAIAFEELLSRRRSPSWRCRVHYYRALEAEVAGDRKLAVAHYRAALATYDNWSTAYGMAQTKLARLTSGG